MASTKFLGKKNISLSKKPSKSILDGVDNPHINTDYITRFTCQEFTSICPITKQPDFAKIVINYVANKRIIESKSLKLYLFSYRNHGAFHEDCTIQIAKDIIDVIKPKWLKIDGCFNKRGGISIDIFYEYKDIE